MFKGWLDKLTITPLLYACACLLLACVGLSTALFVQHWHGKADRADLTVQLSDAQAKLYVANTSVTLMQASIDNLQATLTNNAQVSDELAKRLHEAIGINQAIEQANQTALAERDAARAARDKAIFDLKTARNTLYATDPTCGAWGRAPVCGAISGSVFDQWQKAAEPAAGGGEGPHRGSAGAPAGGPGPQPGADPAAGARPDPGSALRPGLRPPRGVLFQPPAGIDAG